MNRYLTHISLASNQGLHCLFTGSSIKNRIKIKKHTRNPLNEKWTRPLNKDGIVHWQKRVNKYRFMATGIADNLFVR